MSEPSQDTLRAEELKAATEEVVHKNWKKEPFEIYARIGETPIRLEADSSQLVKVSGGNAAPLEWRLKQELGREYSVRGDLKRLVECWLDEADDGERWSP